MFSRVLLKQVRKTFGRHAVLRGVDAELLGGQLTVLMGPNGAGKSTLLGLLSTLSRPTSGEILFGEVPHHEAEATLRGCIGLLAHAPMLYVQLSARENLRFFARLYGVDDPLGQTERWLQRVGLAGEAADRPVRALSRGMTQRASLARALISGPRLLLLDEPFTGLDQGAIATLRRELALCRRRGALVVLVTHDVQAVDRHCDRLLVLRDGRVAADVSQPEMAAGELLECYRAAL